MRRFKHIPMLFCLLIVLSCSYKEWIDESAKRRAVEDDLMMIVRELRMVLQRLRLYEVAMSTRDPAGTTLVIDAAFAFETGSVDLSPEMFPLLEALVPIVSNPDWRYPIAVEVHTDNISPSEEVSQRWPTNWEFSAARAVKIVRFLEQSGVPSCRLRVVGFAENKPYGTFLSEWIRGCSEEIIAASNSTPELRSMNQRVEIRFEGVWYLGSL